MSGFDLRRTYAYPPMYSARGAEGEDDIPQHRIIKALDHFDLVHVLTL